MTVVSALGAAAIWHLVLTAIALLAYPLVFHSCTRLPDRGLVLARALGLLFVVLPLWVSGNVTPVPFTSLSVFLAAIIIGAAGWGWEIWRPQIVPHIQQQWRRLAVVEVGTAALFLGYVLVRGFNPDARATEKPMELAFLSASIFSPEIPVQDPWFAGEPINYYYLGYVAFGSVAKLAGISPGVAFTLSLASIFAISTVSVAIITAAFVSAFRSSSEWSHWIAAALSAYLFAFAGNLYAARRLLSNASETLSASWWGGVGWRSSRVVEDTGFADDRARTVITEFPAFSFILGDLHPHVLALPWFVALLGATLNLAWSLRHEKRWPRILAPAALCGALAGSLYSTNSWDLPTATLLVGLTLLLSLQWQRWRVVIVAGGVSAATAVASALPFAVRFVPSSGDPALSLDRPLAWLPFAEGIARNVGVVTWNRSNVQEISTVHGAFLIALVVVVLGSWIGLYRRQRPPALQMLVAVMTILVASIILWTPAVAMIGIPVAMLIYIGTRAGRDPERQHVIAIAVGALLIVLIVEFFYIRDVFGDRMNTVFKFYFQAWVLLSVSVAALVLDAVGRIRGSLPDSAHIAIGALLIVTLLATTVYAPLSLYRWNNEFTTWRGIDATAYVRREHPDEAATIRWIVRNTDPRSVIVEAPGCSYGSDRGLPHNRVSMATGRATPVGWSGHQVQWRRGEPEWINEVGARVDQVNLIFDSGSEQRALDVLDSFTVDYVIVGNLERVGYTRCELGPPYSSAGLSALERIDWEIVLDRDGARIYARPGR